MSESEREVIGIRGLNPDLYNQILVKAKEMGKNVSDLINDALRMYLDQVLNIPVTAPTVLGEGFVSLVFSKSDLENLGKVIIRGVTSVRFAEDVDVATIEEHVVAVENCTSVSVPQHAYVSLIKKVRNCTHLGSYAAKSSPVSMAHPTEFGMQPTRNAEVVKIGNLEELELSKEDLETFGKRLVLENIEHLRLSPDVDVEAVDKYIEVIQSVEELEVPRLLYMPILTKQRNCQTITKY